MAEANNSESVITDKEWFLRYGEQTSPTSDILNIVKNWENKSTSEKLNDILSYTASFEAKRFNEDLFRKRTASSIIADRMVTGCTDSALAFIALARASGIPAKYIETFDRKSLKNPISGPSGHIYVEVYDNDRDEWYIVNPFMERTYVLPTGREKTETKGMIFSRDGEGWKDRLGMHHERVIPKERVIYKVGLDSWDIGVRDYRGLKQQFDSFRKTMK